MNRKECADALREMDTQYIYPFVCGHVKAIARSDRSSAEKVKDIRTLMDALEDVISDTV